MSTKTVAQQRQDRLERGAAIAATGAVGRVARHRWDVEGKPYTIRTVTESNGREHPVSCTCPDFQGRGHELGRCKHMEAVRVQSRAHDRIDRSRDLGRLYTTTLLRLTLATGWEVHALRCLLATIDDRERATAPHAIAA